MFLSNVPGMWQRVEASEELGSTPELWAGPESGAHGSVHVVLRGRLHHRQSGHGRTTGPLWSHRHCLSVSVLCVFVFVCVSVYPFNISKLCRKINNVQKVKENVHCVRWYACASWFHVVPVFSYLHADHWPYCRLLLNLEEGLAQVRLQYGQCTGKEKKALWNFFFLDVKMKNTNDLHSEAFTLEAG